MWTRSRWWPTLAKREGTPLGRLGVPSTASPSHWAAAGAVVRRLHEAPLPPWPSRRGLDRLAILDAECEWLVSNHVLPADLVRRNRELADQALRPSPPVFAHGDLQVAHVFLDGGRVTGVLDWSEAGRGDRAYDLATLTLGHRDRLEDVLDGYGHDVDHEAVRG